MNEYLLQIRMPVSKQKKVETLTLKVGADVKGIFEEVAQKHDRSKSYVIRELALRGLALYKRDGKLKLTESEEELIENSSEIIKVPDKGKLSDETKSNKKDEKAA